MTILERLRDPFCGATSEQLLAEVRRLTDEDFLRHEHDRHILGPYTREDMRRRGIALRDIRADVSRFRGNNILAQPFPPSSFTAVTASATETNLWTPALWTPIPAFSWGTGSKWELNFGGIFTSTATQGVLTWTYRFGQSATPASNLSLGASNLTAPPASLTNAPFFGFGVCGCRSVGLAAAGASIVGHCFVHVQGAAAATAIDYLAGGTVVATADHTTAQGLIVSLTISVASQSYTCEYALLDAA